MDTRACDNVCVCVCARARVCVCVCVRLSHLYEAFLSLCVDPWHCVNHT